jgi:hypothetical protein
MMKKGPKPDAAKRKYWKKKILEWRRSGLTRQEFCKRYGLSPHTFDYYRYQVGLDPRVGKGWVPRRKFIQVRQLEAGERGSSHRATVILPSGITVEIDYLDLEELKKLA